MKVLVAESIADPGIDRLRAEGMQVDVRPELTREELLDAIGEYDALIVRSATKVDAELIERGQNLKVIGRAGIGVDNVDLDAATRHGIVVINAPRSNAISTAEHAIALLLAQARDIPNATATLRGGTWARGAKGVELHGKVLAILGLGQIGTLVAQRALAFGMKVIAADPFVSQKRAAQLGVELVEKDEALARADFVTIHVKQQDRETIVGERELGLMKHTARLVNVARGGMVDEAALAAAIEQGRLAGAALDVFSEEPTTASPLFGLPQVVVTPHLAASTTEAQDKAGATIADQVLLALRGDLAQYAVNVSVGREIADAIRPFIGLAERLGRLFTNLSSDGLSDVEIAYRGKITEHDTRVLTLSALRGVLTPVVHQPVTFVNAPLLAEERGLTYTETKGASGGDYVNEIELHDERGTAVSGTVLGLKDEQRLTGVWGFELDMPPGPHMVFLRYDDRPGVIGAIGTILGGHSVNIADMRVGRRARGGEALMVVSVDQDMTPEILAELAEGSGAKDARFVDLGP